MCGREVNNGAGTEGGEWGKGKKDKRAVFCRSSIYTDKGDHHALKGFFFCLSPFIRSFSFCVFFLSFPVLLKLHVTSFLVIDCFQLQLMRF